MRIQADDIHLNYEREGQGPTLVLTHGIGGRLEDWGDTVAALRDCCTLLRWDVRGFGQSDRPRGPVTPSLWASDLAALLDALNIPRVVISGHSMGGVVAQRFALDYPQRTQALILISTSSEVGPKATQRWEQMALRIEAEGMAAVVGNPTRAYSEEYARMHQAEIEARETQRALNDPFAYAATGRAVGNYNFTTELQGLTCPTLILQGAQDRLTPPGGSVIISRNIPGAQLHILDGCGHALPIERLDTMAHLIRDFVAQLPDPGPL